MKVKKVSATEARNNFFELVNEVMYGNQVVEVYKNKKPAIRLVSTSKDEVDWDEYRAAMKRVAKSFTKEDEKMMKNVRKELDERIDNNQW